MDRVHQAPLQGAHVEPTNVHQGTLVRYTSLLQPWELFSCWQLNAIQGAYVSAW